MSTQANPPKVVREKPSKVTKDKITQLLQQDIIESGKAARQLCHGSGSREILMKSAKKMAHQEVALENTLENLRHMEKLLDKAMDQANNAGRSIEKTAVLRQQIQTLTGSPRGRTM